MNFKPSLLVKASEESPKKTVIQWVEKKRISYKKFWGMRRARKEHWTDRRGLQVTYHPDIDEERPYHLNILTGGFGLLFNEFVNRKELMKELSRYRTWKKIQGIKITT